MCYMIYCKGKLCFMYLSTVACWGWCHPTVESDLVVFLPHFNWLPSVKWLRSSSWSELFTVGRLRVGTFFKRCSNEHFDTRRTRFLLKNSHTNASKLLLCTLTFNVICDWGKQKRSRLSLLQQHRQYWHWETLRDKKLSGVTLKKLPSTFVLLVLTPRVDWSTLSTSSSSCGSDLDLVGTYRWGNGSICVYVGLLQSSFSPQAPKFILST